MPNQSLFVSRKGTLSCTPAELFGFITDIRNLKQFIPDGSINNWHATSDSCDFEAPPLGTVKIRITETIPLSLVSFSGDALKKYDFKLIIQINDTGNKLSEVSLILQADLNPAFSLVANGVIEKFLEILVAEMEKFRNWKETFKESQPL